MNDAFNKAHIDRFTNSRRHAETAIETALLVCEASAATHAQLGDLADAVELFRDGQYRAATILAEAAIEGRSNVRTAIRPAGMARSVDEIRTMLREVQAAD